MECREFYESLAVFFDREYRGGPSGRAINARPLRSILAGLSAEAAASTATYEGYSAWEVALHLGYCKFVFFRTVADPSATYPYPVGVEGFTRPADTGSEAWAALRAYLDTVHDGALAAYRAVDEGRRREIVPEWGMAVEDIAVWLASHDSYHVAQLNSMGVPGIKAAKLEF